MPLTQADLDAVLAPFAEARPFPPEAYTDPALFAHEVRTLFGRAWRCVGLAQEVARPGQWVRTPIGGGTLLVLRGEDLGLRALYDVCTHRGAPLLRGDRGEAARLSCDYHGWCFSDRGTLLEAPGCPRTAPREALGLREGRAVEQDGLLFASGDSDVPDLSEAAGLPPPWLGRARLGTAQSVHRARWTVAANWKLVVENFQESHHFARVHPLLEARTPGALARSHLGGGAWLGGSMPLAPGVSTVSLSGGLGGRPLLAAPEDATAVHDALLFPLFLSSLQPDYLLLYRLDPVAVDETRVDHELLVAPGAGGRSDGLSDVLDLWAQVHEEDRLICERQQRAMRGGAFRPVCYAACEDGVHAFDQRAAAALRGAL